MLTEDYRPWLIEINSSPSMESSTAITSRLCSSVMEDTMKGVYTVLVMLYFINIYLKLTAF